MYATIVPSGWIVEKTQLFNISMASSFKGKTNSNLTAWKLNLCHIQPMVEGLGKYTNFL